MEAELPQASAEQGGQLPDLSVGQLAARAGVAVSTLHFYERQGLISSYRTAGNQRRYRREVLRRVGLVRIAQRVGIPLADVRAVLDLLPNQRTPTREDWERLTQCWKADLDERIHRLAQLRDEFTGCIGCGCMSLDLCPLANPGDVVGRHGPGPRRVLEH
jgi:MerR family transcriptional regulator, redox-sensitive transcriptional activator SoxR